MLSSRQIDVCNLAVAKKQPDCIIINGSVVTETMLQKIQVFVAGIMLQKFDFLSSTFFMFANESSSVVCLRFLKLSLTQDMLSLRYYSQYL